MFNIRTQFSPVGIYCLGLDGFQGIVYNNYSIFNGVILLDFHDVLSIGVLLHSINNPFHRMVYAVSLKGPRDPLI